MIKTIIFTTLIMLLCCGIFSCTRNKNELKNEIRQTEKDFQKLLNAKGAAVAFYAFAADSAAILRERSSPIIGKDAIKNYYSNENYKNATAIWNPDFIDISDDGTMAYTFGKYEWTFIDTTGKKKNYSGIFHTVWKRMPDNTWKFVWD